MLNLAVDRGNSRIKAGLFKDGHLVREFTCPTLSVLAEELAGVQVQHAIVSSVSAEPTELQQVVPVAGQVVYFNNQTPVPVTNNYGTPHTLGVDRMAAAVGAYQLFENQNCLVIDAGTAITYDVLDENGVFQGGNISLGLDMRYKALHAFTGKLPQLSGNVLPSRPGKSTTDAITGGVLYGAVAEVEGFIRHYERQYKPLTVILCGGDARFFESTVKARIFVIPELVLIGLNRILEYNV
ncbi:type III pantothenate kinase [Rufibacter roseus]|uniref:Type III pantothenate kinase n=1 Tax=Rufibacter roseus TaxID=1567108 RepID=A0ABW2DHS1_9BACT|nr:type III pantothenate kinase [Rufibacter roseus]